MGEGVILDKTSLLGETIGYPKYGKNNPMYH